MVKLSNWKHPHIFTIGILFVVSDFTQHSSFLRNLCSLLHFIILWSLNDFFFVHLALVEVMLCWMMLYTYMFLGLWLVIKCNILHVFVVILNLRSCLMSIASSRCLSALMCFFFEVVLVLIPMVSCCMFWILYELYITIHIRTHF